MARIQIMHSLNDDFLSVSEMDIVEQHQYGYFEYEMNEMQLSDVLYKIWNNEIESTLLEQSLNASGRELFDW